MHNSWHLALIFYIDGQAFVEILVDLLVMATSPASLFLFHDKVLFFGVMERISTQFLLRKLKSTLYSRIALSL